MIIYARKNNLEYTIIEEDINHYVNKGFNIIKIDEKVKEEPKVAEVTEEVVEVKEEPKPKATRKPRKEAK